MPHHLHLDPFNGISGDMLLAALLHLGASPAQVESAIDSLRLPGVDHVSITAPDVAAFGVRGRRLEISLEPMPTRPHTESGEIRGWIQAAPLSENVKEKALRSLEFLAGAEALARGEEPERVRFHEFGGYDTAIDLVGVAVALELLGVAGMTVSSIPLTRSSMSACRNRGPSPSQSTLELLKGFSFVGLDLDGEVVTPTGAALTAALGRPSDAPPMVLEGVGIGFGRSEYPGRPNCLRLYLGAVNAAETAPSDVARERLRLLEANIDDLPGEVLGTLIEACLQAGALDAWLTPILMKKGRPANLLQALCTEEGAWPVEEAIFRHTSTLGIRRLAVERDALPRGWIEADTPWGTVRVKEARLGGRVVNRAPEFEDCRRVAAAAGVPVKEVYAAALAGLASP